MEKESEVSQPSTVNLDSSLENFANVRKQNINNPFISYLNINSLRGNKVHLLRDMLINTGFDVICIDETKLTCDFPDSQFYIEGYQHPPYRRDRNDRLCTRGGGKIVYVKSGMITKRLKSFETRTAETICLELNMGGRKWFIVYAYRPESINRELFFDEITSCLDKATKKYDFIILIGDLNVDMDTLKTDIKGLLHDICDSFDLTNLINTKTCTKRKYDDGSSLDVILRR